MEITLRLTLSAYIGLTLYRLLRRPICGYPPVRSRVKQSPSTLSSGGDFKLQTTVGNTHRSSPPLQTINPSTSHQLDTHLAYTSRDSIFKYITTQTAHPFPLSQ
jgi:hypothetical protein